MVFIKKLIHFYSIYLTNNHRQNDSQNRYINSMKSDNVFQKVTQNVLKETMPNVRKSIIIGLGGSGISGINQGRKFIVKNLPEEALKYIRWVGMDTTDIRTSIEGAGGKYRFPNEPYEGNKAEEKINYIYASTKDIKGVCDNLNTDPVYGSWFPSPSVYNISTLAGQGANQQRPLGRLAFFQNYDIIRNTIKKEIDYLLNLSNDPKYFELMDITADSKSPDGKGTQITVFMTGSVMGGTCSGSFIDMAALVQDLLKDIPSKIYGIYVLPQAFEKVVDNPRARANSYAALKELDYFMSGNKFEAMYPGGHKTRLKGNLFDNGRVYLLDRTNMNNHSVQDRDQVQQITSQLIYHFVSSSVGGKIEERLVNLSDITAQYFPKKEGNEKNIIPRRKAVYNSFGISRVIYPVPQLRTIGLSKTAQNITKLFFSTPNHKLLKEFMGDLSRGLLSEMRLSPRILFDKLFPDYQEEFKLEFKPSVRKINEALKNKNYKKIFDVLEIAFSDYGDPTRMITRLKKKMLNRYAKNEFDRVMPLLEEHFIEIIQDQNRGFNFAEYVKSLLEKRVKVFRELYYENLVKIEKYSNEILRNDLRTLENKKGKDIPLAKNLLSMLRFNYEQSFYQAMLEAAVSFTDDYLDRINTLYHEKVQKLRDKLEKLDELLDYEIKEVSFSITEARNPIFQYLLGKNDIEKFFEVYFKNRLGLEELGREIKFYDIDKEDDELQKNVIATYGTQGKQALESDQLLENLDLEKEEIMMKKIFHRSQELKAEILTLKKKLENIILKRYENFDFESISIKEAMKAKSKDNKELMTDLDFYSRPYITVNTNGLDSIELYRTVTQFELSDYEVGDVAEDQENDLPFRLDHYKKRAESKPPLRAEMFVVPQIVKPYEVKSIGLLLSFPIFAIESMKQSCDDYHDVLAERKHPLHLFNAPGNNAIYYPDPFMKKDYMNPLRLWKSLIVFKLLEKRKNAYYYIPQLQIYLKEFFYRNQMQNSYKKFKTELENNGGFEKASINTIWKAATLSKTVIRTKNGYVFDSGLLFQIKGILDKAGSMNKDMPYNEYIKQLPSPVIKNLEDWKNLLNDSSLKNFLLRYLNRIFDEAFDKITEGVEIEVSKKSLAKISDIGYKDSYGFFAYLEKKASNEFYDFLKNVIAQRIFKYIDGTKFRIPSDPSVRNIKAISEFLQKNKAAIPETVLFDLKAYYGI